jgi:hypothetical protein
MANEILPAVELAVAKHRPFLVIAEAVEQGVLPGGGIVSLRSVKSLASLNAQFLESSELGNTDPNSSSYFFCLGSLRWTFLWMP